MKRINEKKMNKVGKLVVKGKKRDILESVLKQTKNTPAPWTYNAKNMWVEGNDGDETKK